MKKVFFSVICLLIGFSGCAWISPKQKIPQEATQYVQIVRVIDKDRLQKGGKLLLVAFKPGSEVVANEEFDKIAFMILKGVADELPNTPFELLGADRVNEAELILEGWIQNTGRTTLVRKMMFRNEKVELKIEGKLLDRKSGRNILVFTNSREAKNKNETLKELGLKMGYDLGKFIVNELKR